MGIPDISIEGHPFIYRRLDEGFRLPDFARVLELRSETQEYPVEARRLDLQGFVINVVDHVLRTVEIILSEAVCGLGTKGPVDFESEKPAGGLPQGRLLEGIGRRHLPCPLADEPKVFLDQIDIGHAEAVKIPVIEDVKEGLFFLPGNIVVAGAKMPFAEFPAVKGDVPEIGSAVLKRVKQTAHTFPLIIEEAQILAAVDHLVELGAVLRPPDLGRERSEIARAADGPAKEIAPAFQPLHQTLFCADGVIVKTATGAAGFFLIGLAEMNEILVFHGMTTIAEVFSFDKQHDFRRINNGMNEVYRVCCPHSCLGNAPYSDFHLEPWNP